MQYYTIDLWQSIYFFNHQCGCQGKTPFGPWTLACTVKARIASCIWFRDLHLMGCLSMLRQIRKHEKYMSPANTIECWEMSVTHYSMASSLCEINVIRGIISWCWLKQLMISFIISFSKLESTPQAAIWEIVVVLSIIKFTRQWSNWQLID